MNEKFIEIKNIGKVIIRNTENGRIYLKELNGKLVLLSKKDSVEVEKLFFRKRSNIIYSERLNNLIDNNKELNCGINFNYYLNIIENMIPEEYHENFYTNVSDLQFEVIEENDNNKATGYYNIDENKVTLCANRIKNYKDLFSHFPNPSEMLNNICNEILFHELLHMSSSNIGASYIKTGFDTFPITKQSDQNLGLTEGFTELIASGINPTFIPGLSGYYIELCIANQLAIILGKDIFYKSYFGNEGVELFQDKLDELHFSLSPYNGLSNSYELFRNIESNFLLRDVDSKHSILSNIELCLLSYLKAKVKKDIDKGINPTLIYINIINFEKSIVKPEILKVANIKPENHLLLDEVKYNMESFKEDFIEKYINISRIK